MRSALALRQISGRRFSRVRELNDFLGRLIRVGFLLVLVSVSPAQVRIQSAPARNDKRQAEQDWLKAIAATRIQLAEMELAENHPEDALLLFHQATAVLGSTTGIALGIANANLQLGRPAEALPVLRKALALKPGDVRLRRTYGEALAGSGKTAESLGELERVLRQQPKDLEALYLAGTIALKLHDKSKARAMYATLLAAVPGAATHVLIGRLYRDFGYPAQATSHLRRAIQLDPHAQRAHYYLGTIAVTDQGAVRLDEAEREFRQELAQYPEDYSSNLYAGVVLSQQRRYAEAELFLSKATSLQPISPDGFVFLAQCYLELHRYEQTVDAAQRAISLTPDPGKNKFQIANTHYVLAQALRKLGKDAMAEEEFAVVQKLKEQARDVSRDELRDYLGASIKDAAGAFTGNQPLRWLSPTPDPAAKDLTHKRRQQLEEQVAHAQYELGLSYFREQRMPETLDTLFDLFRRQPDYAGVRKAYGTALFMAGKYSEAVPLLRRLLDGSEDTEVRRMLGQAYFHTGDYANAVAALQGRSWDDVPTQYMLATALVRGGQEEAAEQAFSTLLREHSDSAELQTLLGQASAQQRDYAAAIEYYQKALTLDASVPEAHLGIALVKMRNGELKGSEAELRTELRLHPGDLRAKYYLAYVLGMSQKHSEAEMLLRAIIAKQSDFPEAHATLGAQLLAQNRPAEALEQLLVAYKLTPSQPKLNYQLGLVYRKLGRKEEAERAFARSRELRRQGGNIQASDPMQDDHD